MKKEELVLLSLVAIVAIVAVFSISTASSYTDVRGYDVVEINSLGEITGYAPGIESITGNKIKIKKPKFVKQIQKEAARVERRVEKEVSRTAERVEKEVARTPENIQKGVESATEKIKAEGRRFDRKTFRPIGDKIEAEADRFGDRVQKEWERTDDNLKEIFSDKIRAELKRLENRANEEIERNMGPLVDLVKGDICAATDSTDVQQLVEGKLKPMFMGTCTPMASGAVQLLASPLQAIPYVGQALYAMAVQIVPQKVCSNAFKKVLKEATKKCESELPEEPVAVQSTQPTQPSTS